MNFKQSLDRIEEILELMEDVEGAAWDRLRNELRGRLDDNAEDIVKLARVCKSLERAAHGLYALCPQLAYVPLDEALAEYNILMKGEEK